MYGAWLQSAAPTASLEEQVEVLHRGAIVARAALAGATCVQFQIANHPVSGAASRLPDI
jgi:hypothetical protein